MRKVSLPTSTMCPLRTSVSKTWRVSSSMQTSRSIWFLIWLLTTAPSAWLAQARRPSSTLAVVVLLSFWPSIILRWVQMMQQHGLMVASSAHRAVPSLKTVVQSVRSSCWRTTRSTTFVRVRLLLPCVRTAKPLWTSRWLITSLSTVVRRVSLSRVWMQVKTKPLQTGLWTTTHSSGLRTIRPSKISARLRPRREAIAVFQVALQAR